MIKSMTGFGRCELSEAEKKITVEIKSVNHRYFDLNLRMPKKLNAFEVPIRNLMKEKIKRGKIDMSLSYDDFSTEALSVTYNETLAAEYVKHLKTMAATFDLQDDITVSTLSRYPDVFIMEEQAQDEKQLWAILETAVNNALSNLVQMRVSEGASLQQDLKEKLDAMLVYVDKVEVQEPITIQEHQTRLRERIEKFLGEIPIDETRLASEIVLYSDKICTDEETVRLKSHIVAMKEALQQEAEIGRHLDFLAQEMNREANTILSKANNLETSNIAIALKTEIEKLREQIQNIE